MNENVDFPLLSVIIPTHNRPQYLPRAVKSALQATPDDNVEVIVVPNGGDETWQESLADLLHDSRIIVSPVEKGHANVARNHGLRLAKGKYVRFLDDDDFFHPEVASEQLKKLIELDADISCGQITKTDEFGNILEIAQQLDTDDFIAAATGRGHSTATCALVIKKNVVNNCVWDENIDKNQDVYWAWEICKKQELKSIKFRKPVAAWVQHSNGFRVSKGHHRGVIAEEMTFHLLALLNVLIKRNALTENRANSIADSLWNCIHDGIMFKPIYWLNISFVARKLSKNRYPNTKIYNFYFFRKFPLVFEVLLIPWRWLKFLFGQRYLS